MQSPFERINAAMSRAYEYGLDRPPLKLRIFVTKNFLHQMYAEHCKLSFCLTNPEYYYVSRENIGEVFGMRIHVCETLEEDFVIAPCVTENTKRRYEV